MKQNTYKIHFVYRITDLNSNWFNSIVQWKEEIDSIVTVVNKLGDKAYFTNNQIEIVI